MSGQITFVVNDSMGQPIAAIDDTGAVRVLDMTAVRKVAAAANLPAPTSYDVVALLVLHAYEMGKGAA